MLLDHLLVLTLGLYLVKTLTEGSESFACVKFKRGLPGLSQWDCSQE